MPLFRVHNRLHYFAHVPKCAGQSVEAMLRARFGALGFLDDGFGTRPRATRWTRGSPQHVVWDDMARLIPPAWIESRFAVVRHPVARVVSAWNFRVGYGGIAPGLGIEEWFDTWVRLAPRHPWEYDGHLRAQGDFVPPDAQVFRLEDGLCPVAAHLDALGGETGPAAPQRNASDASEGAPLSDAFRRRLCAHYAADFERFGYDPAQRREGPVRPARSGSPAGRWRFRARAKWLALGGGGPMARVAP